MGIRVTEFALGNLKKVDYNQFQTVHFPSFPILGLIMLMNMSQLLTISICVIIERHEHKEFPTLRKTIYSKLAIDNVYFHRQPSAYKNTEKPILNRPYYVFVNKTRKQTLEMTNVALSLKPRIIKEK